MASMQLLFLATLSIVHLSSQDVNNNNIDREEESPLAGITNEILKEKNLENIGGMVNSFIQSGGAKQLMDGVLQNLATNENSGQLLESLGSLLNTGSETSGDTKNPEGSRSRTKSNDDINPMELLSGLGSIVGAMQGAGGDGGGGNPAALLQGLGSLLGGGNNGGEGNNAAALLQGLGSILASTSQEKGRTQDGDGNMAGALLQGLGSILGAAAGGNQPGENGAGALLQGLGALMGGGQGGGEGGLNPEMIGNVINMFANSQDEKKKTAKPSKSKLPKKAISGNAKSRKLKDRKSKSGDTKGVDGLLSLASTFLGSKGKEKGVGGIDVNLIFENIPLIVKMAKSFGGPELKKYFDPLDDIISVYNELMDKEKDVNISKLAPRIIRISKAYKELVAPYVKWLSDQNQEESFDFSNLVNVASSFLNQANNGKGGSNFMDYLPMIINTISSFTDQQAQERANSHSDHSWALPPVIERIHIYFDNFINSEMGKQLLVYLGEQKAFKVFRDEKGNFNYNKFEELIENHSFRKHWIQQVTNKLADFLRLISDENVQSQYIGMGITFTNSFLQNSGFPNNALIDTKRLGKSITNFANFAARKYLDAEIDTKQYVEPAIFYAKDLLKLARASLKRRTPPKELTDKLTNTINMEIIEPITRVNRAYRFTKSQPKCDRYLLCIINQETSPNDPVSLPGLKKALYKGSSLIAGWFLSSHTGTSYWDLYNAVTDTKNCKAYYNEVCGGFYQEEVKATTEYVHNEL